ncbi:hypothetical protein CSAL01_04743 [Colletotrichum salicis]|uniref:Avirulence Effector AvrLm4-7 domain-containing protein n=1 Tax=Colletotrichum salicis TaxID=1209931 RepID=A0A135UGY8_9PEZI|nr:hypothetical protein CSAL01_04743 [Colletotrichum salicis]
MKFFATAALILALSITSALGQLDIPKGEPYCTGDYLRIMRLNRKWIIHAMVPNTDDIPRICGGLWDNLKSFPACSTLGIVACEHRWEGMLTWRFGTMGWCNHGMIESVWWEATKNKFGPLKCKSKVRQ